MQQVGGQCEVKDNWMKSNVEKVKELEAKFQVMKIEQISQEDNRHADFLEKIGSLMLDCRERKITVMGVEKEEQVLAIYDDGEDWRLPIIRFLEGDWQGNKREIKALERNVWFYICSREYYSRKHFAL